MATVCSFHCGSLTYSPNLQCGQNSRCNTGCINSHGLSQGNIPKLGMSKRTSEIQRYLPTFERSSFEVVRHLPFPIEVTKPLSVLGVNKLLKGKTMHRQIPSTTAPCNQWPEYMYLWPSRAAMATKNCNTWWPGWQANGQSVNYSSTKSTQIPHT